MKRMKIDKKRQVWMLTMEKLYLELGGQPGKVDWYTAEFLYGSGRTETQAAESLVKSQQIERT